MQVLNLGGIVEESVVDGPGIRFVLFAQGCRHNCPACFNQELQVFRENTLYTIPKILEMIDALPHLHGVTFSGGDPFEQATVFGELARACRTRKLNIWAYTGYTFEKLITNPEHRILLQELDVLVDGPFVLKEKDPLLPFRGSRNQRLIDVQASLISAPEIRLVRLSH